MQNKKWDDDWKIKEQKGDGHGVGENQGRKSGMIMVWVNISTNKERFLH